MNATKTHFEQIPVETVKRIAEFLPSAALENMDDPKVEVERKVLCGQENWRQLAQRVLEEPNPENLTDLVQRLVVAFDKEKVHKT